MQTSCPTYIPHIMKAHPIIYIVLLCVYCVSILIQAQQKSKHLVHLSPSYYERVNTFFSVYNVFTFLFQLFSSPYLADRPEIPFFDIISQDGHGIGSRPYDFIWKLHTRIVHSSISKVIQTQLDDMLHNSLDHLFKMY